MSKREVGPIAKTLIEANRFLENPDNWCPEGQGADGVDGHRRCAIMALYQGGLLITEKAAANAGYAQIELARSAQELFGKRDIVAVNRKGHSAVKQLYLHAISKALSEGK